MGNGPCGVVPATEVATYGPQYRFNVPWELLKRAVEKFVPLGWSVVFFGIWDFGMEKFPTPRVFVSGIIS